MVKVIQECTRIEISKAIAKETSKLLSKKVEITVGEGFNKSCNSYIIFDNCSKEEIISIKESLKKKFSDKITRFENLKDNCYNPSLLLNDASTASHHTKIVAE